MIRRNVILVTSFLACGFFLLAGCSTPPSRSGLRSDQLSGIHQHAGEVTYSRASNSGTMSGRSEQRLRASRHHALPASGAQRSSLGRPPACVAGSMIIIDAKTGGILSGRAMTRRRGVASTQKLLTALLVVERGNLDGKITVQPTDTYVEPSKLYLKAGQTYTRRQLVEALLIKSGNDVAKVLARDHSGSSAAFGRAMTVRARQLGAMNSAFKNPHGLTESGQYSTAQDMARIAYRAYRHPTIRAIVGKESCTFRYATGTKKTLENTNKVLKRMPSCTGMKTGYTHAAGRCLVSSASWHGREVILVQLGSKTKNIWDDAEQLMGWALGMRS